MRFAPALALTGSLTAAVIAIPAYAQQTDDFNRTGGYYAPGGRTAAEQPLQPDRQFMRSGRYYGAVSVGMTSVDTGELYDGLGFIGNPSNDVDFESGYSVGGSIGMYLDWFRLEGELTYRHNDMDGWDVDGFGDVFEDGHLRSFSFMANGFYDITVNDRLDLYAGAGIGAANIDGELEGGGERFRGDDWVLAWQLMAGIAYQIRENIDVTLGYRYFDTEDYDFDDEASFEASATHAVELGLRFTF